MQIELHVTRKLKGHWYVTPAIVSAPEAFKTQKAAIAAAERLGRKHKLETVVHGRGGLIRKKSSHGYDSPKRKG